MRSAQASIVEIEKGKRYRVFVEAGRDINTGKRKRYSKRVTGSRKDAEKAKLELLIKAGETDVVSEMTLAEYCHGVFIPHRQKLVAEGKMKRRTVETYEDRIRLHIEPTLGSVKMSDLTPKIVRRWLEGMDRDSIRREAYKALHAICQRAVYDDQIPSNPVSSVEPPKPSGYEPEVLDMEDIEVYLWHFRGTRIETVVLLVMGGAFRRGEIDALDAEDINLTTGRVEIDDAYVESRNGTIHETTKTGKKRIVYLPEIILERLREILPENGPVARRKDGARMKPNSIRKLYVRTMKTLPEGVPRVPLRNLRHTSLTLSYDSGADIMDVSNRAGHSGTEITKRYYLRPKGNRDVKAAKMMDETMRCHGAIRCQRDKIKLVADEPESF